MIKFYKEKEPFKKGKPYVIQDKDSTQLGVIFMDEREMRALAVKLYKEVIKDEHPTR